MILVIDDNPDITDWLREVIQGGGYYYDVAVNAPLALYKMRHLNYSMALIDVILTGNVSGDELARQIKKLPAPFGLTPLVAMTGGDFEDDPVSPLFVKVLRKPFMPDTLKATIHEFARPPVKDLHIAQMRPDVKEMKA